MFAERLQTMDQILEVLTWSHFGLHRKPCGFLNTNGYFDSLFDWVKSAFEDHFIYEEHQ